MCKTEINKKIIAEFAQRINKRGLTGKLELDPICNTFKRRKRYTVRVDGTRVFTVFMWDLNNLNDDERTEEIRR